MRGSGPWSGPSESGSIFQRHLLTHHVLVRLDGNLHRHRLQSVCWSTPGADLGQRPDELRTRDIAPTTPASGDHVTPGAQDGNHKTQDDTMTTEGRSAILSPRLRSPPPRAFMDLIERNKGLAKTSPRRISSIRRGWSTTYESGDLAAALVHDLIHQQLFHHPVLTVHLLRSRSSLHILQPCSK